MPGRIFGLDFGRVSPQLDATLSHKSKANAGSLEVRPPSMDHIRPTLGLAKKHSSDKKERSSSKDKHAKDALKSDKPIKLGMVIESPPVLMMDTPALSSGALISGRLQVTPNTERVELQSITMFLECLTSTKTPVHDRCRDCASQVKDLKTWEIFNKPTIFTAAKGTQDVPFSHLIPGHLPATTHGVTGTIDYQLHVRAKTTDGVETEYQRPLLISRALRPGNDKNSVRVFPPTNLTLNVTLPNIVHQIGEFPVTCRMTGITTKMDDNQTRWRVRKLNWRIEEHEVSVSPACKAHAHKVGGEGRGIQREETKVVGADELKHGWKTDLSDATIEFEFMASLTGNHNTRIDVANCGIDAVNGHKINHNLVMELVIAEEWAPNKKPENGTPTGAARVLRTQFALNVTERAGMGIAWDDEQPPMYEDVPASPPHYQNDMTKVLDYHGDDLHGDVEDLTLNH